MPVNDGSSGIIHMIVGGPLTCEKKGQNRKIPKEELEVMQVKQELKSPPASISYDEIPNRVRSSYNKRKTGGSLGSFPGYSRGWQEEEDVKVEALEV
ncbi:hypothetical protein GH714_013983 [Hevea brasiliensis]|uniref:Uncharacterized protein n=1 Tax=Hevea brasiliensis TaxID=3981 RepID=A0A6A6LRP0_HEVBR|nr:hypothetical protein GH714_013983 [Hevea brasiliensis]